MTMVEREPLIDGPALRQFADPTYKPLCTSLKEIRAGIDSLDEQIVALLAKRAMFVKDAARFKADSYQVAAPARQAQVFAKVRTLALKNNLGFVGFEDVIEATYQTMVAQFVAVEQRYFHGELLTVEQPSTHNSEINKSPE
jgi:isochorismate pyruvate lyase